MAGRSGGQKTTTLNLTVVAADAERDLLLVKGSVPGPNGGLVLGRDGVKGSEAMAKHPRRWRTTTSRAKPSGSVELDDALFGVEPNIPVMHQVVTAQLAARRAGTQSTKTGPRCGAAAPSRGARRAPAGPARARSARRSGGGRRGPGPKPRSYAQRTPKKMIRLALASALSDRRADDKVMVLDDWGIDAPSTKGAVAVLAKLGVDGRVLVVLDRDEDVAAGRACATCPRPRAHRGELNAYDVLVSDWVVFTRRRAARCQAAGSRAATDHGGASRDGPRDVIVAPVVSEKSYALMEDGASTRSRSSPHGHQAARSATPCRRSSA